ncbi:uncharacterized protein J3R85_018438 [Psidium guajava]|nr:uncharacterized protein J3R85_018438 [Psidium guajava]
MEDSEQWLELGTSNGQHVIPGSTLLGFDGSYNGLENAAGRKREKINLGQEQLITAVNQLASSTDSQERAKSLIIVIQMICESIRFESISNHIATTVSGVLPDEMLKLENGWGDLSDALLWDDAIPGEGFKRLKKKNILNIETVAQAVEAIGILLGLPICKAAPPRDTRMVEASGQQGQCTQGRPLVEVFSVVREKDIGGKLYGKITVTDGVSCQSVYNQTRDEGDSGLAALLTGPAGCISAYGSFIIDVDLMDDIKGQVSWNVYDITNAYDKLLQGNVSGQKGSVTVNYAVFREAVEAIVEVTLSNGDGNDADVYGQITAHNSNLTNKVPSFKRLRMRGQKVRPREHIPLSRSVLAVPLNSSLMVWANLFDKPESGREIANGTATFLANYSGTSEKDISGKYGTIRVKVTWTVYI